LDIKYRKEKPSIDLSGANLINIQRLGLRLKLKKASTGMHSSLRLTVIFESYNHELEAFKEPKLLQGLVLDNLLFGTLSCGMRPKISHWMIY